VQSVPDLTLAGQTSIPCVIALPGIGVSTPLAFRQWDRRFSSESGEDLHNPPIRDTLNELSRTYASVFHIKETNSKSGASGIFPDPGSVLQGQNHPEKQHGLPREQLHGSLGHQDRSGFEIDLAENSLLALVRTGSEHQIENDFETVVFPQYPLLRDIKRHLMGSSATETGSTGVFAGNPAIYAALSGSGSALFGLYRTQTDATAAQQRLQQHGVQAIVTATMPRPLYWTNMFAE
jgi:4-diphosphocytidyl-2-C-methyl-D-erythritol kinase